MFKSQFDILALLIAILFGFIAVLTWHVFRMRKLLKCMKSNLNLKNVKVTTDMIKYAREQRDKYHWSHAKYKAYNDTLKAYGAL